MSTPDQHTDLGRRDPAVDERHIGAGYGEPDAAGMAGSRPPVDRAPTDERRTRAAAADPAVARDPDPHGRTPGSGAHESGGPESGTRERLFPQDRAEAFSARWDTVKGMFVDEPRRAVEEADALVGELLDDLQTLFREQRSRLDHGLDAEETSTEDLRLALRRYRSFFDRLLSL